MVKLQYFLGKTTEEAKEVHDKFVTKINSIAREYSLSTGIDKKELFNEAFMALSNAVLNYDIQKGDFNTYALYSIKRHLNEFISTNTTIAIPRYINRTISLLKRLERVLVANGCDVSADILVLRWDDVLDKLNETDVEKCEELLGYLKNIATRSNISLEKLIKRATYIPSINYEIELEETLDNIEVSADSETIALVKQLFELLTEEEAIIAHGIMEGKSKKQIGREMNKSDTWVNKKLKEVQRRINTLLD